MKKVIKKAFYLCFLMSLFIISSTQVRGSQITPTTLGERITVADGRDPDIAVDKKGNLHLVYVRGQDTYYRQVFAPYTAKKMGPEYLVGGGGGLYVTGGGSNPQIALDSKGAPHIVFGAAKYAYWQGSRFIVKDEVFSGWMKNLIAIDSKDRVYIIAERYSPRTILMKVYQHGKLFGDGKAVTLGQPDNPGGADIGADDILHFSYRVGFDAYHNTYDLDTSTLGTKTLVMPYASDFTWCSFDSLTNTIHVVATKGWGAGIGYIAKRNNKWVNSQVFDNPIWIDDPDNANPVSTNDARGYTYVTYQGSSSTGRYLVIDENDKIIGGVNYLDPEYMTSAGYKTTNPNVASNSTQNGAFVSWGTNAVYVRSIGVVDAVDVTIVPAINLLLSGSSD